MSERRVGKTMSNYKKRVRNLYGSHKGIYPISRSKIDLFLECPRCFYLDRKLGLDRPDMPGWPLNSAVDHLLKKEFDIYRAKAEKHPLMEAYGIDALPFQHEDLPIWRDDVHHYVGASVFDQDTGLDIRGIVEDLWVNGQGELLIVDYKATSTNNEISLEDEYKQGYKRQMEIYQWLFRKLGFTVSSIGYFVFANGLKDKECFDSKLEFDLSILPYQGDDSWVSPTLMQIRQTLDSDTLPDPNPDCQYCAYRRLIAAVEG